MTFIFWFNPRLLTSFLIAPRLGVPVDQFQIGFCILLISWTLFSLALFLLEGTSRHQARCLVIGNIINACFFAFLGLYQIYRVRPHLREGWDERFWFLIALGIMYLVFAFCYKKLKMPRLIVACGAVAISSAAVALMIHFPRLSLSYFWLLEMTICFALGLYYRESLYRWMGWFLSALIFLRLLIVDLASVKEYPFLIWDISQRFLSLGAGAIVFYGLSVLFSKEKIRGRLSAVEVLAGDALTFVGTVLLTFLVSKEALAKWLTLSWTAQGGILLALGFLFKLKTWRWCSLAVLTLAFVRAIFFDISGMNSLNKIIAFISLGGVLLIVSLVYARVFSKSK